MSIVDWLVRIFSFGRGILSLVFAVAFCSLLLNLSSQGRQTFHDVLVSTFLYPAQVALSTVNRSVGVFSEHESLKAENARFRVEVDRLRQQVAAMPRQGQLEAWSDTVSWQLKKAMVIAEQPSRFATSWVINLGTNDSVDANMPVLTSRGIVGKVVKSYARHSLVQLMTDPSFRAAVSSHRSRARGLIEFWKIGQMVARFPVGSDIQAGDTLVTNGLGGVFPKGLLVGTVESKPEPDPDQSDVLLQAWVIPSENPNWVEEVFVMIHRPTYQVIEGL